MPKLKQICFVMSQLPHLGHISGISTVNSAILRELNEKKINAFIILLFFKLKPRKQLKFFLKQTYPNLSFKHVTLPAIIDSNSHLQCSNEISKMILNLNCWKVFFEDTGGFAYSFLKTVKSNHTKVIILAHAPSRWLRHWDSSARKASKSFDKFNKKSEWSFIELRERYCYLKCDIFIFPTKYAKKLYSKIYGSSKKYLISHYPVIQDHSSKQKLKFRCRNFENLCFISSTTSSRKGLRTFLSAIEKIQQSSNNRRIRKVYIVGLIGPNISSSSKKSHIVLSKWADKNCVQVELQFFKSSSDVANFLRSCSALTVLSSLDETYGCAAAELILSRSPFIASKIPAFDEIIGVESNVFFRKRSAKDLAMTLNSRQIRTIKPNLNLESFWINFETILNCND